MTMTTQEVMLAFWTYRPLYMRTIREMCRTLPQLDVDDVFSRIVCNESPRLAARWDASKGCKLTTYIVRECRHLIHNAIRCAYGCRELPFSQLDNDDHAEPYENLLTRPERDCDCDPERIASAYLRCHPVLKWFLACAYRGLNMTETAKIAGVLRERVRQRMQCAKDEFANWYQSGYPIIPDSVRKMKEEIMQQEKEVPERGREVVRTFGQKVFEPKKCAWCDTEFRPDHPRRNYCSRTCSRAAHNARNKAHNKRARLALQGTQTSSPSPEIVSAPPDAAPSQREQVGGTHYLAMAIQPIDFILANGLGFCEGNIIKYLSRYRRKNGLEDLLKARQYLDILIESFGERESV